MKVEWTADGDGLAVVSRVRDLGSPHARYPELVRNLMSCSMEARFHHDNHRNDAPLSVP